MKNENYKQQMIKWVKELVEWQLRNPDKTWQEELFGSDVTALDEDAEEGGDRPPTPPIKP